MSLTGRVVERFRGGKLAQEHIYWDQASVLVQLGLLDSDKLPVSGAESARKVLDPAVPANSLNQTWTVLKSRMDRALFGGYRMNAETLHIGAISRSLSACNMRAVQQRFVIKGKAGPFGPARLFGKKGLN